MIGSVGDGIDRVGRPSGISAADLNDEMPGNSVLRAKDTRYGVDGGLFHIS